MKATHSERLSDILKSLAEGTGHDTTLGHIVQALGERAFGALILMLAAPNLIPLPPGSSALFGLPLLFITAQLMIGQKTVWLPRRLSNARIGGERLRHMMERLIPYVRKVERLLKPRGTLLTSPFGERLAGLACLFLSIVLFLPIPLANMAPAFALCCFALGLIEQDAGALAAGWVATAGTAAILVFLANVIIATIMLFVRTWISL